MELLHPSVTDYLNQLSRHGDPVLERLEAEAAAEQFPIVGPAAGQFCYLAARMIGARRICELGSGFGYSTLWFARAVRDRLRSAQATGGGEVIHTVWDEGLSLRARRNVAEAGFTDLVRFHVGEAVAILRELPGPFDVIFNDIDKDGYPASLPVVKEKLRPGGILIIDNMLWHGRLFDPEDREPTTEGIRRFTTDLWADSDWVKQLLPIRDGLILALKSR
jgi:predicted O-methyltransferase YrrM